MVVAPPVAAFAAPVEVGSPPVCFPAGSAALVVSGNAVGVRRWSILLGRVGMASGVLAGAAALVSPWGGPISVSVPPLGSSPLPQAVNSAMARAIAPVFMSFPFMSFSTPFSLFTPGSRGPPEVLPREAPRPKL